MVPFSRCLLTFGKPKLGVSLTDLGGSQERLCPAPPTVGMEGAGWRQTGEVRSAGFDLGSELDPELSVCEKSSLGATRLDPILTITLQYRDNTGVQENGRSLHLTEMCF